MQGPSIATVVILAAVLIALIGFFFITGSNQTSSFKSILDLTGITNGSQLVHAIQQGISNYSVFDLTYSASAKVSSNPIYPITANAQLSIYRNGSIFGLSLSVQNPMALLGQQSATGTYSSVSEYNGSGFVLCIDGQSSCTYKKAVQTGAFSSEISSALSGLFSASFFSSPYLMMMEGGGPNSNSSDFAFTYKNTQTYDGEKCAYMQVTSTQVFTLASGGLSVNGQICVSEALGLPVYGNLEVSYDSVAISLSFSSTLT